MASRRWLRKYVKPGHPAAFAGIAQVRQQFPHLSQSQIKSGLASVDAYTRHREAKRPSRFNPYFIYAKRYMFQADLMDVQNLARWNDKVRYLLFVLDCFSRKLWVQPLGDKKRSTVLGAFNDILNPLLQGPLRLVTDRGKEFANASFQKYLREKGIRHIYPSGKAPHVERVQRTLQGILYKYLTHKETRRYIDVLQNLVRGYNARYHSTIGMSPNQAERPANTAAVNVKLQQYYDRVRRARRGPKYKVGDPVRIQLERTKFAKGREEVFSVPIYVINRIRTVLPIPLYQLEDAEGQVLEGSFYESELQIVAGERAPGLAEYLFKIERVLANRFRNGRKEVLVKWLGYPERLNSWVPENDLHNLP